MPRFRLKEERVIKMEIETIVHVQEAIQLIISSLFVISAINAFGTNDINMALIYMGFFYLVMKQDINK